MDIRSQIRNILQEHPAVLFMKGTPEFPMCGDSARAAQALQRAGLPFHAVNVQADPFVRAALSRYANWASLPQLYVQGDLVGGAEVVLDLLDSGELARMARGLVEWSA